MISKKETVAVVIKTYYREDALFKTVSALKKNFDVAFRLYIADDSRASDKKEALYSSLAREGHCILRLTADSGISFGRNAAVRALQGERLVLVMDDDIEIRESGVAEKLAAVLACRDDTGIAAGLLMSDAGGYFVCENYARGLDFQMADGLLRRVPAARNTEEAAGGVAYSIADQVPNFFLARREVFDSTLWDERIKVEYEHMDFFLSLKKAGRWRAVVCPDARAWHLRSIADDRYLIGRRSGSAVYFLQKWGLRRVFNSWGQ
jgi:GT2 family glycosyltransferase